MNYSIFIRLLEKTWEYNGTILQLFTESEKACGSVRREVLYNILTEFCITVELVRLIKMCVNGTYSKVRIGKDLSDAFPVHNDLKQGDAFLPLLFNFTLEYAIRKVQESEEGLELNGKIRSWSVLMMLICWVKT